MDDCVARSKEKIRPCLQKRRQPAHSIDAQALYRKCAHTLKTGTTSRRCGLCLVSSETRFRLDESASCASPYVPCFVHLLCLHHSIGLTHSTHLESVQVCN
jgi:hypothetical protein